MRDEMKDGKMMNLRRLVLAGFCMGAASAPGAPQVGAAVAPAPSASAEQIFRIDGGDVTYAVGVTKEGALQTVYWGAKLGANDPLPRP